jgi:hypothetical protein
MAKAVGYASTRLSLGDARKLLADGWGSEQLAEELLDGALRGGMAWDCKLTRGKIWDLSLKRELPAPSSGGPEFWRYSTEINWAESWARIKYLPGSYTAYGITLSRADVIALLPSDHAASPLSALEAAANVSPKVWITDEFAQMKETGELPANITDCAQVLHDRMREAQKKIPKLRVLKPRTIENGLRNWGLWSAR